MPTDTLYGLVGSAFNENTVARIYKLRKRNLRKPMIILIGSLADLKLFNLRIPRGTKKILREIWPGKVSVILPCPAKKFSYLHRGKNSLAFRLPQKAGLIKILKATGPLVAPSANFEGEPPAKTIKEAKRYFGNKVDFYLDGGKINFAPSTLIEINPVRSNSAERNAVPQAERTSNGVKNTKLILHREGDVKIKNIFKK